MSRGSTGCKECSWTWAFPRISSPGTTGGSAFRSMGRSICGSILTSLARASDLVNQLREAELAQLFFELGEERFSRRIARRIVEDRKGQPIQTTGQLAELVRRSVPGLRDMGRSTHRHGSSRRCVSRLTMSSASSTPRSSSSPICWRPGAERLLSAFTRSKIAELNGRSRLIPSLRF